MAARATRARPWNLHRALALVFALVLPFDFLLGCSRDPQDTPEGALSAWVAAMNASRSDIGARRRAFDLLGTTARESLTGRAARASQLAGREIAPWEMLAPGRFAMRFSFDPEELRATVDGDHATVVARSRAGEHAEVPMVRENGHWRVDLALPGMQPAGTPGDGGT